VLPFSLFCKLFGFFDSFNFSNFFPQGFQNPLVNILLPLLVSPSAVYPPIFFVDFFYFYPPQTHPVELAFSGRVSPSFLASHSFDFFSFSLLTGFLLFRNGVAAENVGCTQIFPESASNCLLFRFLQFHSFFFSFMGPSAGCPLVQGTYFLFLILPQKFFFTPLFLCRNTPSPFFFYAKMDRGGHPRGPVQVEFVEFCFSNKLDHLAQVLL